CASREVASDSGRERSARAMIRSGARQSEVQTSGSLFRATAILCSKGVSEFCWFISCLTHACDESDFWQHPCSRPVEIRPFYRIRHASQRLRVPSKGQLI